MGPKSSFHQPSYDGALSQVLRRVLQDRKVSVGIVLGETKIFPSIYKFLWDALELCSSPIPIADVKMAFSGSSWREVFGENFSVTRNIASFLKSHDKLEAVVIISEAQPSASITAERTNVELNLAIVFPPFPKAAESIEDLIDSGYLTESVPISANQDIAFITLSQIIRRQSSSPLKGQRVLVTAGPTQGPIDAVRYVSSTSSGSLGSEIADQLYLSGCEVHVLLGKGSSRIPLFAPVAWIQTPDELQVAVEKEALNADIIIFAAAVLDYVPREPKAVKTPSGLSEWTIELKQTPKIINLVKQLNPKSILVGFKLLVGVSDQALLEEGKKRLQNVDILVANDLRKVSEHTHEALVITKNKIQRATSKLQIAQLVKNELENFSV
ncbi:MAG: phosphopantothenoylcysteine decarboxylase [Candidatus Heimdallarchaeota archaeon]